MACSKMNELLEQLKLKDHLILDVISKPTAPSLEGWNDKFLCELAGRHRFHPSAFVRGNIKLILSRFYEFYLNGTVRDGDDLAAVVGDAIALGRTRRGPIFSPENFDDHAVDIYTPNRSTDSNVQSDAVGSSLKLRQQYKELTSAYTENEMKSFCHYVRRIISNISVQGEATLEEAKFLSLTGFLALTLLCCATKNEKQMANIFLEERYRTNLTSIADWDPANKWMPPCKKCIETCVLELAKGRTHTTAFFILIVKRFYDMRVQPLVDYQTTEYLVASVLAQTELYGLGAVQMLKQVCRVLNKSWEELRELTTFNYTKRSWENICKLYSTYARKEECEITYSWARIIDDRYLRGCSPKENVFLCVIFATVLEKYQGPGVWSGHWIKGQKEQHEVAVQLGEALFQLHAPSITESEPTLSPRNQKNAHQFSSV